jgi:type I restriction enzyme S subunit
MKTDTYVDSGVAVIRGQNITDDGHLTGGFVYVSEEFASSLGSARLLPGDIVLPHRGAIGRAALVPEGDYVMSTSLMRIRLDRTRAFPAYVRSYLCSDAGRQEILKFASTVGTPGIGQPLTSLRQIKVPLAPIEEQRRIAGVLGAVDDLIDLNVAQVASLTSLVQAEFERRYGQRDLSLTIADVADVIDCLHSKKPERVPTGEVLLQLNNILDSGLLDMADTYLIEHDDYVRWTKNLETQQWDCVITNVGRVGAVARIPADVSAALGRNMTAVRPQQTNQDGAFLIAALRSPAVRQEIELRTDAGTILNALNVRSIPKLRLQNASISERESFQAFAAPLLTLADSLHDESINLARQRNELLPLLLSGQVRVEDVVA